MPCEPAPDLLLSRGRSLAGALHDRGLDGILLTDPADIFYTTGFRGSAGIAFMGLESAILWVDPRYTLQAREQARDVEVVEVRKDLLKTAGHWLRGKARRVGYQDSELTCREFSRVRDSAGRKISWVPCGEVVRSLRVVKDPGEIAAVRQACRLTSEVYMEVLPAVGPGVSELDLAAEIEFRMKRKGAEGPAFQTIVASGRRAAFPHGLASSKLLEKGDLVIFDLGAILHGYASDMTRTVCLGGPSSRIRRLYAAVREAQRKAVEAAVSGAMVGKVDAVARRTLARHKLEKYFTHSTGHGVGIEIHENPRIARGEKTRLKAGSVITVEPGVYLEGFGGIRIEDTLVVTAEGPEILTSASKDDWIVG